MDKKNKTNFERKVIQRTIEREREMDKKNKKNFERKVIQRNGYERGCKKIMETG